MARCSFIQLQPILGTRDIEAAIRFYVERLGFVVAFRDGSTPTNYVGLHRDGVELHVQFQHEHEMGTTRVRFRVDDPDALYAEYVSRGVAVAMPPADMPWGTRDFALYDPDRNALSFYRPV